jgi:hypothetical protein
MSHYCAHNSTIKFQEKPMSLLNRLLYRFSAYCRCRVINGPDRQPYLERYHLLRLPFGYRVYLHRFVASDPGRGLHNHPWRHALSLVLCGSYRETRMLGARDGNALHDRWLRPQEYRDHNEIVAQASNPDWWKQAERPISCPQMRMPCPI